MPRIIEVVRAAWEDHKTLVKISRQSPYTKGFSDVRYVQEYYTNGWVGKLEVAKNQSKSILGFVLVRHCKREPWTTIYYAAVAQEERGKGLGVSLLDWVERETPHQQIRLGVDEANVGAERFWLRQGFKPCDVAYRLSKHGLRINQFYKEILQCKTKQPG